MRLMPRDTVTSRDGQAPKSGAESSPDSAPQSAPESAALTTAVRAAAKFDRRAVSIAAGLLAAVPVVALLGGGLLAGDKPAAVTMGAGAMLVGIAWRTTGGRPPLALMAVDAALMATSTFLGCVTGSNTWLHLIVLCLWSLLGGLLVSLGQRGAVLGTQAIIAVVVFGRFSEPAAASLGLAAYVLVGGWAQVLFLTLVRWPPPLRGQRAATAAGYRALANLATASATTSTLPVATALDEAQDALSAGALFGDPALMTLRSLVNEGQRMRVQLSAIHALLTRDEFRPSSADEGGAALRAAAEHLLALTQRALALSAAAIAGDKRAAQPLAEVVAEFSAHPAAGSPDDITAAPGSAAVQLRRRLAALAGQLRAIGSLAPSAGEARGLRSRRPQRRTSRPMARFRADLSTLRDNTSLDSPAGRHALRLAVVVPAAELLARTLPLHRGYWMVVAAATVLRPEFGATWTRGTERALGTFLGVAIAGAIAATLHPIGSVTVAIVFFLAWSGYAVFPASFAVGFAFITALTVFLLNAISPDTLSTAGARLLDTLVGGAVGLIVFALWPTWSRLPAQRSLAEALAAQRIYLGQVLAAIIAGRRAQDPDVRPYARRARLARTTAESAVARSLAEPATRRIDAGWSEAVLAATRRFVQAVHVLRLDVQEAAHPRPFPDLTRLANDLDALLRTVEHRIEAGRSAATSTRIPDLRSDYAIFARRVGQDPDALPLLGELDEIVDAANGVAALVGLEATDEPTVTPADAAPV